MPWVRLDDGFGDHPKVLAAGNEAVGLHCRTMSWSARALTDGHVPHSLDAMYASKRAPQLRSLLIDSGLRDSCAEHPECSVIHDWLHTNESAETIKTRRQLDAERKRRGLQAESNRNPNGIQPESNRNPNGIQAESNRNPNGIQAESERSPNGLPTRAGARAQARVPSHPIPEEQEPLAPAKPPRERDPIFDAVAAVCGIDLAELTDSARGALNRACRDLRQVGATPGEIPKRASVYRARYPDTTLTPSALAKHWPNLNGHARPGDRTPAYWRRHRPEPSAT